MWDDDVRQRIRVALSSGAVTPVATDTAWPVHSTVVRPCVLCGSNIASNATAKALSSETRAGDVHTGCYVILLEESAAFLAE